jgi:hypothetical protein
MGSSNRAQELDRQLAAVLGTAIGSSKPAKELQRSRERGLVEVARAAGHIGRAMKSADAGVQSNPSPSQQAEVLRQAGNAAFRGGNYDLAVQQYTASINVQPRCAHVHAGNDLVLWDRFGLALCADVPQLPDTYIMPHVAAPLPMPTGP